MTKLLNIDLDNRVPKYLQIVDSIADAIRRGYLKKGERIFSINEFSNEYFTSRDTVQKAYNILHQKGIITSVKGKGYYIKEINLHVSYKVLLLLNKISNYKKEIYNAFIHTLGDNATVDIKIHHYNTQLFKNLVSNNLGDYDYFVVTPHFHDDPAEAVKVIKTIPAEKLVILDKQIPHLDIACPVIYQDFEHDIVDALEQGLDLLQKYKKLFLVYPNSGTYAPEIAKGFRNFCLQNDYQYQIVSELTDEMEMEAEQAYIVIEEGDLAKVIRKAKDKDLQIGQNFGIISYNENPLKEILLDGITVISTDHKKMGETAARQILENRKEKVRNPFALIRRKSL